MSLCRFEFFEMFLRIGILKLMSFDKKLKYSTAFQRIIEDYVIPFSYKFTYQCHLFREQELWTIAVSDILEANQVGLDKLF